MESFWKGSKSAQRRRMLKMKLPGRWTLLHHAAGHGSDADGAGRICSLLLRWDPSMAQSETTLGITPMRLAITMHKRSAAEALIEHCPDVNACDPVAHHTPLMDIFDIPFADWIRKDSDAPLAICRILVERFGACPNARGGEKGDLTVLHMAAQSTWKGADRCAEYLLERGADPTLTGTFVTDNLAVWKDIKPAQVPFPFFHSDSCFIS